MTNVTSLSIEQLKKRVDLEDGQLSIEGAEKAAIGSLNQYLNAGAAFTQFMEEFGIRPSDRRAARILLEMPTHITNTIKTMMYIERCHAYTNDVIAARPDLDVRMSGGLQKDELPRGG